MEKQKIQEEKIDLLKAIRDEFRADQKTSPVQEFEYVNMNDPEVQNTHNYFRSPSAEDQPCQSNNLVLTINDEEVIAQEKRTTAKFGEGIKVQFTDLASQHSH